MGGKNSKAKKSEVKKQPSPVVQATSSAPQSPLPAKDAPLKVLIIFANPEPQSFCAAIRDTAIAALRKKGCEIKVTDLYQMKMFLPLDRADFTHLEDPDYFKPQAEQVAANAKQFATFSEEVRKEHEKVAWCDLMLFIFPLYWWSFPGIMKNWVDRVLTMGFAYGLKGTTTLKGKKGMFIYTTGGPKEFHRSIGLEDSVWKMINHGVFQFCGVTPLEPFVAYQVAWVDDDARKAYLRDVEEIMENIDKRPEFRL